MEHAAKVIVLFLFASMAFGQPSLPDTGTRLKTLEVRVDSLAKQLNEQWMYLDSISERLHNRQFFFIGGSIVLVICLGGVMFWKKK